MAEKDSVQKLPKENKGKTEKEIYADEMRVKVVGGLYATEVDDVIPPLETMRFLDENGNFTDSKLPTKEDLAYYWRAQQGKIALVMAFCGIGLLLVLLSATNKYADIIFNFLSWGVSETIKFLIGLITGGA